MYTRRIPVSEASQVGEVRRAALAAAKEAGLGETDSGKLAIIATEAATNLAKHAQEGEVLLRVLGSGAGVEVLAVDSGPGMPDLVRCLRDGYSSSGSPGTGLGAIGRLGTEFDVYTQPGTGTALMARIGAPDRVRRRLVYGAVCIPRDGEPISGDAWAYVDRSAGRSEIAVADGLGHGMYAAEAAREAVRLFSERDGEPPDALLGTIHAALRATRGAAMAIASLAGEEVTFTGVGNISGVLQGPDSRQNLVSENGTLGHQMRRVRSFTYRAPANAVLILHSDGLTSRWDLSQHPGLAARHPSLIAGVLYKRYERGTDDVTVVVAREAQ